MPEQLYDIVRKAFHHRGFSFIRVIQRCPEFLPKMFEPWLHDPTRTLLLTHANGLQPSADLSRIYRNQRAHDPLDINAAREIASVEDPIPVGILYHNPEIPCYEDLRGAGAPRSPERTRAGLEAELDKYTIWPEGEPAAEPRAA
jgi:2-oxoglutarate ferredoxin oxidoreductase subunit beta